MVIIHWKHLQEINPNEIILAKKYRKHSIVLCNFAHSSKTNYGLSDYAFDMQILYSGENVARVSLCFCEQSFIYNRTAQNNE